MPAPEITSLNQRAVLWTATGKLDRYGKMKINPPIEIRCRWNKTLGKVINALNEVVDIDGTIIVLIDIPLQSRMWLAPDPTYDALTQWYGSGSAGETTEVMEVISFKRTPDERGREFKRTVSVKRYKDQQSK